MDWDEPFPLNAVPPRVRNTILLEFKGRCPSLREVAEIPDSYWLETPNICSATRECVSKATARFTRCRLRLKSTYRVTGRHGGAHEPARSGGSHDYQGIGGAG
ncbi:hypothetical protein, partial [Microvirga tunisiensis]|uniref:hypothetical protein n=1 Tax=Microvirga tunisiensis TaxID=2108360 RepID=UPI001AEEF4B2